MVYHALVELFRHRRIVEQRGILCYEVTLLFPLVVLAFAGRVACHAAVPYSIKEVDKESYDQPDCKSNPGEPRQGEHQSSTEGDPQEWNQGDEGTAEGPLHVRVGSS